MQPITNINRLPIKQEAMGTDRVLVYCPNRKRTFTAELSEVLGGSAKLINWEAVDDKPETATRWPKFIEVTGKPEFYPSSWSSIVGAPTEFDPTAHSHPWEQVTSKPVTATRWPTFTEVTDKPAAYPTTIAQVQGLQDALDAIMQALEQQDIKLREDIAGGFDIA